MSSTLPPTPAPFPAPAPATAAAASNPAYPPPSLPSTFVVPTKVLKDPVLHRVYWQGRDPMLASVGAVGNRYDCLQPPAPQYGVLYVGESLDACWLETVFRKKLVRTAGTSIRLNYAEVATRRACEIRVRGELRVVDFTDLGLLSLGDIASNVMADDYDRTHMWSQLLHAHGLPAAHGIRYRSRLRPGAFCIAIFERAMAKASGLDFKVTRDRSMNPTASAEALRILKRYGAKVQVSALPAAPSIVPPI